MYHGCKPDVVHLIFREGFRPTACQHIAKAVYLTPSIRYAAHPRYSRLQKLDGTYFQVVLQCRVLNKHLTHYKVAIEKGGISHEQWLKAISKATSVEDVRESGVAPSGETLGVDDRTRIDESWDNSLMEFLYMTDEVVRAQDGIVVTGVMVRRLPEDPVGAGENAWWLHWNGSSILRDDYTTDHTPGTQATRLSAVTKATPN